MAKQNTKLIKTLLKKFDDQVFTEHRIFLKSVLAVFEESTLVKNDFPVIHSIKNRIKNKDHLEDKLKRKIERGDKLNEANVLSRVNDLAGLRLLHIHTTQFSEIHKLITEKVDSGFLVLHEKPKAYTWDPESKVFFETFGLGVEIKPTFYTSVHYVVKPKKDSKIFCEIQVRTLFEEIWGEIEHAINYPKESQNIAVKEQLKVLAKLVGAGNRLSDSIFSCLDVDKKEASKKITKSGAKLALKSPKAVKKRRKQKTTG